jgi:hypothetical protein
MTGRTGQTNPVSGIYRDSCHRQERAIPKGHTFPPCAHCHKAVTWVLVRRTDTNPGR